MSFSREKLYLLKKWYPFIKDFINEPNDIAISDEIKEQLEIWDEFRKAQIYQLMTENISFKNCIQQLSANGFDFASMQIIGRFPADIRWELAKDMPEA